ncbi:hypothetical protein MMC21_004242 [Puttea exsequens]|nr:hypothetical protein [Puttea exsequens]
MSIIESVDEKWDKFFSELSKDSEELELEYREPIKEVQLAAQALVSLEGSDPSSTSDLDMLLYLLENVYILESPESSLPSLDQLRSLRQDSFMLLQSLLGFCFELAEEEEKYLIRQGTFIQSVDDFPRDISGNAPPGISKWRRLQMEDRARMIAGQHEKWKQRSLSVAGAARKWMVEQTPIEDTIEASFAAFYDLQKQQEQNFTDALKNEKHLPTTISIVSGDLIKQTRQASAPSAIVFVTVDNQTVGSTTPAVDTWRPFWNFKEVVQMSKTSCLDLLVMDVNNMTNIGSATVDVRSILNGPQDEIHSTASINSEVKSDEDKVVGEIRMELVFLSANLMVFDDNAIDHEDIIKSIDATALPEGWHKRTTGNGKVFYQREDPEASTVLLRTTEARALPRLNVPGSV